MKSIETDQTKSDRRKFLGSLAAGAGLLAALSASAPCSQRRRVRVGASPFANAPSWDSR